MCTKYIHEFNHTVMTKIVGETGNTISKPKRVAIFFRQFCISELYLIKEKPAERSWVFQETDAN
jgi:hypothetical protein